MQSGDKNRITVQGWKIITTDRGKFLLTPTMKNECLIYTHKLASGASNVPKINQNAVSMWFSRLLAFYSNNTTTI